MTVTIQILIIGASWVTAAVAIGGVLLSWRRNGKSQAARDTRIQTNQEHIIQKIDDPTDGLTAINEKVNNMVNNCAIVSTGLSERVKTAERDIHELKSKHK